MIRNIWSILCRDIITDQETNSVSYIHCIEEGAAPTLPTIVTPIYIGTLWEKDSAQEEPFSVRVKIVTPSGIQQPLLQTKQLVFSKQRQRLHFKMERLKISEYGRHEICIELRIEGDWHVVNQLPLIVKKLIPPQRKKSGPVTS
jgi:hypothetical protein